MARQQPDPSRGHVAGCGRRSLELAAAGMLAAGIGQAGACESGYWLANVSEDGLRIELDDGSVWRVESIEGVLTVHWQRGTAISLCEEELVNVENDEAVVAERIR